jgi:hypothetical protein
MSTDKQISPAAVPAELPPLSAEQKEKLASDAKRLNFQFVCMCMNPILDYLEWIARASQETPSELALKKIAEVRKNVPPHSPMDVGAVKHAYELSLVLTREPNWQYQCQRIREDAALKDEIIRHAHSLLNACQKMYMIFVSSEAGKEITACFAKGWDKLSFVAYDPNTHTIGVAPADLPDSEAKIHPIRISIAIKRNKLAQSLAAVQESPEPASAATPAAMPMATPVAVPAAAAEDKQ